MSPATGPEADVTGRAQARALPPNLSYSALTEGLLEPTIVKKFATSPKNGPARTAFVSLRWAPPWARLLACLAPPGG